MNRIFRIIASVALLAIAIAVAVLFVWPKYQEFAQMRTDIAERKDRLSSGQAALAKLRIIEGEVSARQGDFDKAEKAIPKDQGLPALYEYIQQLAIDSGLLVASIEGQETAGSMGGATVVRFGVKLTGSYGQLKGFLAAARKSARILNVESLTITADSQGSGNLTIQVELSAYAKQ